jgi:hypothetical protein
MLAISSGVARAGTQTVPAPGFGQSPDDGTMCTASAAPAGFPKTSPSCPGVVATQGRVYDGMGLELTIKAPTNALGLSFDFDFLTTEFPTFVCNQAGYNDQFVALLGSSAAATPADRNISFDSRGNSVNVNSGFLQACAPTTVAGKTFTCPLGTGQLEGTGILGSFQYPDGTPYTRGGATGWLSSRADVVRGETLTLRFAVWDAGDNSLDTTALVDHFAWTVASGAQSPPPPAPPQTIPIQ